MDFVFFCSKTFSQIFSLLFLRANNHQLVDKENLIFKPSYLNSNFVLTLGYLNPALNNPAQGAQQRISIKKLRFPTRPRAKVRHQGHRPLAQPCFQECLELLAKKRV